MTPGRVSGTLPSTRQVGLGNTDDHGVGWYSKRYGFEASDCPIAQAWLAPVSAFFAGDLDNASSLWWGASGVPQCPRSQRALQKTQEIGTIDDDRWDRCMGIGGAVKA